MRARTYILEALLPEDGEEEPRHLIVVGGHCGVWDVEMGFVGGCFGVQMVGDGISASE